MRTLILTTAIFGVIAIAWACHSTSKTSSLYEPTTTDTVTDYVTTNAPIVEEEEPLPPLPPPKGKYVYSSFESTTKGEVNYCAYLPPGWKMNDTTTYPLLIYLYGQGGNEFSFARVVKSKELDKWVNDSLVCPMVIICVRGEDLIPGKTWDKQKIQWYTSDNEKLLLSEEDGELRAFCRERFRAGMTTDQIALEGHSRGATGTLHYALKHPGKFSSYLANAYVSDYTLVKLKNSAKRNKSKFITEKVKLRMEIGTRDFFVHNYGRQGSWKMHDYLDDLNMPHEFDTLSGINHHYWYFWNFPNVDYGSQGLAHLKYHEKAWARNDSIVP